MVVTGLSLFCNTNQLVPREEKMQGIPCKGMRSSGRTVPIDQACSPSLGCRYGQEEMFRTRGVASLY